MTWRPTEPQLADALVHAERSAPRESCGVIAGNFYRPVENRATEHDSFVMDMRRYCEIARREKIEAIVHSHVDLPPFPSEADRTICEKLGLPWLIVSWPSSQWQVIEPCGFSAPLVGRHWAWGAQDCLAIIRDGLKHHAGIAVPDFDRDWNFWKRGEDLIARHFREAGFVALPENTPPKHCDVFGMQMPGSPVVNHLALFLAPDLILHQLMGQLSRRQLYDGFFQRSTVLHLRHEALA
jgi:proteasome lid subunit RPN8/RPN11